MDHFQLRGLISPPSPPEKFSLASFSLSLSLPVLPAIREELSERSITSIRFSVSPFPGPHRKISRSNNYEDVEIKAVPRPYTIIIRSGNINESASINKLFLFVFLVSPWRLSIKRRRVIFITMINI